MEMQACPICSTVVPVNPRYPRYLCGSCTIKATSSDGRLLEFGNTGLSGGFAARYADTGEEYSSHECFVGTVKCRADESRFGGIVIEAME